MLLLSSCAKVVVPTGGPKDTTPPKMLKEQPANASVNFANPVIKITFDEFFTLNNPNENVLVSPPFEHQPDYKTKGKTLIIKIKDTLQANTTYNMVFSNCIQDYNESNKLNYYHYSFSTGSELDSFKIKGVLQDAKTMDASTDFFVMLYKNDIDSLPLTTRPDYVTKSVSNGSFEFQNIAAGNYKIFALKDINANLLYDLPNEAIAYLDAPIAAYQMPAIDTAKKESIQDSMPDLHLYTFSQTDSVPKLQRYENPTQGIYQFPYSTPIHDFTVKPLGKEIPYFQTMAATADTITWYTKEVLKDTLSYIFTANGHSDTVQIRPYKRLGNGGRGSQTSTNALTVSFSNVGHRYKPLTLNFSYPIKPVDSFPILVYTQRDTIRTTCSVPDTFTKQLPLPLQFEDKKSYTVVIPDSIFWGYNGLTHDTLKSSFTAKTEKEYGNLLMTYQKDCAESVIAQLWSGERLLQEDLLNESKQISYQHLDPGIYRVCIIKDRNSNGQWDAGNYHLKQQPEEIIYFQNAINIRAFWDDDETFVIP